MAKQTKTNPQALMEALSALDMAEAKLRTDAKSPKITPSKQKEYLSAAAEIADISADLLDQIIETGADDEVDAQLSADDDAEPDTGEDPDLDVEDEGDEAEASDDEDGEEAELEGDADTELSADDEGDADLLDDDEEAGEEASAEDEELDLEGDEGGEEAEASDDEDADDLGEEASAADGEGEESEEGDDLGAEDEDEEEEEEEGAEADALVGPGGKTYASTKKPAQKQAPAAKKNVTKASDDVSDLELAKATLDLVAAYFEAEENGTISADDDEEGEADEALSDDDLEDLGDEAEGEADEAELAEEDGEGEETVAGDEDGDGEMTDEEIEAFLSAGDDAEEAAEGDEASAEDEESEEEESDDEEEGEEGEASYASGDDEPSSQDVLARLEALTASLDDESFFSGTSVEAASKKMQKGKTNRFKDDSSKISKWLYCGPARSKKSKQHGKIWIASCVYQRKDKTHGVMTRPVGYDPSKAPKSVSLGGKSIKVGVDLKKKSDARKKSSK